jgi:hypothetical protein
MASAVGWLIICLGFSLASAALLWPARRILHRRFPLLRHQRGAFVTAIIACSVLLWMLIPVVVGALFGRTPH